MASELKVDNISEKTTNAGVQLSSSLGFVSKTTTEHKSNDQAIGEVDLPL